MNRDTNDKTVNTVPEGIDEKTLLESIENAVRVLAPGFAFGIWSVDDIRQEARLEAWRVLPRWDRKRPLDNFLYTCIRNRLIRLKRDKLRRNDPPCKICLRAEGNRTLHEDGAFCGRHLAWVERNDAKAGLMRPVELDRIGQEKVRGRESPSDEVEIRELLEVLELRMPVSLRGDWLRMRAGHSIPKARRVRIEEFVRDLLGDALPEHAFPDGDDDDESTEDPQGGVVQQGEGIPSPEQGQDAPRGNGRLPGS